MSPVNKGLLPYQSIDFLFTTHACTVQDFEYNVEQVWKQQKSLPCFQSYGESHQFFSFFSQIPFVALKKFSFTFTMQF